MYKYCPVAYCPNLVYIPPNIVQSWSIKPPNIVTQASSIYHWIMLFEKSTLKNMTQPLFCHTLNSYLFIFCVPI